MKPLPFTSTEELLNLGWDDIEPAYRALEKAELNQDTVEPWLLEWTAVSNAVEEMYNRLYVATSVNTADKEAEEKFNAFMENIFPKAAPAEQKLKSKFIESGLAVEGMRVPLRNMRVATEIFREENLALFIEEEKLSNEHDKIEGAQTVQWEGEETTVRQMEVVLRKNDREIRRKGWELMAGRQLEDRETINRQWVKFMELRQKIADNAGLPSFREFRWKQFNRFDYAPEDSKTFQDGIREAVVPAVQTLAENRRKQLGLDSLRYYDLFVDVTGLPPLKPFSSVEELKRKASGIFHKVLPAFGDYFDTLDRENLLDIENRKNKAGGAYSIDFPVAKKPFIFANAVGIHDDVQTMLHESGHAFHAFESFGLPYYYQRSESALPMEFAEVASMGMEYLALPYLEASQGGFYSEADAARARVEHIWESIRFWPYMAIVDAFQHWAYENADGDGKDPDKCDQKWGVLEDLFRPYIDWRGYEDIKVTGWQRKHHIHQLPFYYVEYGLAQLGAVQIWRRALEDQACAVADYRKALALGGTVPLPELFKTAGAKFAFDAGTLQACADLMVEQFKKYEQVYT